MPTTPRKPRARIDPPWKLVFPGLGWHFALEVDGKPAEANWVVTHPDVGKVVKETGEFWAHAGFRLPRTEVVATTRDTRHVARAAVHVMVGPVPLDGPFPVDDYQVHPGLRSLRWNDLHGRRAVLLMTETLMQLPREFLDAVGPVAVLRVPGAGIGNAAGMHLPFPQRVVLINDTDRVMSLRPESGEFTKADHEFVDTFIHELAHVALANRALSENERDAVATLLNAALAAAAPTKGMSLVALGGALYARYYAFARRDLVTEYAERTGWVVNNPNPLGFLWKDLTEPPNAVTGWGAVGRLVGLRNVNRPVLPIPLGPGAGPIPKEEVELYWQAKGFASKYAGTDVHEDFAEAVTVMALGWPVIDTPAFAPRREWIIENGFWPKKWEIVKPGKILDAWARDNGRPLPNVYDWAVNFGLYSGRPPEKARLYVHQPEPRKTPPRPAPGGPVTIMSVEGDEEPAAGASGPEPDAPAPAELGEGDAMEYSGYEDDLRRSLELARDAEVVAAHHAAQAESVAPALARVREVVEGLEAEFRSGSAVELLRAAECRGDGVLFLGEEGVEDEEGAYAVPGRRAEPGDVLVAAGGALYVTVGTDPEGRLTRLAGDPAETGSGRGRGGGVRGKSLRYFWSPGREPRAWAGPGGPAGEYADLPAALSRLVGLWGEREGRRRGSDLSVAGDFVAEVLTAAGHKHRGLAGSDADGVREYLDGYGEGVRPLGKSDSPVPAVGDLVRLRREGLWGVCTRARGPGEPLDVLFQGGLAGHAGEEEDAVVLRHAAELRRLGHVWRPAAVRRARG